MIIEKDVKVKPFKDYGFITIADKRLQKFITAKGETRKIKLEIED